jgi:phosphotriesterase-related protein
MNPVSLLTVLVFVCVLCATTASSQVAAPGTIQTVCGPIDAADMGPTLTHEHILVDFIGAGNVSPDRYDADEVFEVMLPYLKDLRAAGIRTLFECTPDYLGRDPALLKRLSLASGLHIVTNTGWYKDPFLPPFAHEATAEDIAARWIEEATEGIGPEKIKPGFIKIAVNPGDLIEVQQKIVRAAALTSKATGLTIACHTGHGGAALQELDILEEVGLEASRLVVVHCDSEPNQELHWQIAERGAWLSYDGIREGNAEKRLPPLLEALKRYPEQLLISQDAGWYHVGEPRGGDVAPLDWLPRQFVPMLKAAGATQPQIDQLLIYNPARAFGIRTANG